MTLKSWPDDRKFGRFKIVGTRPSNVVTHICVTASFGLKMRIEKVDRKEHCCIKCNDGLIRYEYHVLLQCQSQDIVQLRNKYILEYYRLQPNHFKFVMLMQIRYVG